jgi:hemolysin activation/secretion protein
MLGGRVLAGFGDGVLPPQRLFGLGGIGSVHGYSFKHAIGERMVLLNGEFRQKFGRAGVAGLAFIDAGRVFRPIAGSTEEWLKGVGVGLEMGGDVRLEFGWRLNDIPGSLQVLFRLGPTF